jgi:thymidine kinase
MSLELIVGCMYSGKSSELMRRVHRLQSIDKPYIIYNSSLDTRYGSTGVYTHNQSHLPSVDTDKLVEQLESNLFQQAETIFIDEAQFFPDLYEFVKVVVDQYNKHVIVIGLDGDSDRNNFGDIHRLLPLCDDIIKLKALCSVCKDGTLGIFSKKIVNSSQVVDVGSVDKYIAVCRACYMK